MSTTGSLAEYFGGLADDYLMETMASGALTPLAAGIAAAELARRGLAPPRAEAPAAPEAGEVQPPVVLETVARSLGGMRLEILRARLEAEGIPAFVTDGNTNRVYSVISIAMGGARLQVPGEFAAEARRIIGFIESGAFTARAQDVEEG